MDDAGSGSLFAVVEYPAKDPPHYSILQLDHDSQGRLTVDEKVRFNQPQELSSMGWWFSGSKEDLYMVPEFDFADSTAQKPLHGFKLNFRTGSFLPIKHVPPCDWRHVVNLRGDICFMVPNMYYELSVFMRYDPDKDSWNVQKPFRDLLPGLSSGLSSKIVATAVWDDTILFNLDTGIIVAYDVSGNKSYPVDVVDEQCFGIVGEAVVLGNTIYALTNRCCKSVLALSIVKKKNGDDLVFKCSLLSRNVMTDMEPIPFDDGYEVWMRYRHLVHLGKDNFCVVQCVGFNDVCQPIQVTYITRKSDDKMIMTHKCVLNIPRGCGNFLVKRCFFLPKGVTNGLKQGTPLVLDCNPYVSEDYAPEPDPDDSIVVFRAKRRRFDVEPQNTLAQPGSQLLHTAEDLSSSIVRPPDALVTWDAFVSFDSWDRLVSIDSWDGHNGGGGGVVSVDSWDGHDGGGGVVSVDSWDGHDGGGGGVVSVGYWDALVGIN